MTRFCEQPRIYTGAAAKIVHKDGFFAPNSSQARRGLQAPDPGAEAKIAFLTAN
jgi:hypothetical protein